MIVLVKKELSDAGSWGERKTFEKGVCRPAQY